MRHRSIESAMQMFSELKELVEVAGCSHMLDNKGCMEAVTALQKDLQQLERISDFVTPPEETQTPN